MTKLKKIVLFATLSAILLAIVTVTAVSLIKYGIYRSQFKDAEANTYVERVIIDE